MAPEIDVAAANVDLTGEGIARAGRARRRVRAPRTRYGRRGQNGKNGDERDPPRQVDLQGDVATLEGRRPARPPHQCRGTTEWRDSARHPPRRRLPARRRPRPTPRSSSTAGKTPLTVSNQPDEVAPLRRAMEPARVVDGNYVCVALTRRGVASAFGHNLRTRSAPVAIG